MSKLSLRLGEGAWNLYAKRQTDPKFKEFSASIHKRDNNHCYFCGFSSNIHMMVVNLDHDYTNNKMSNLVTACPFCQQCLFLEACGKLQPGGGTMVYLPDISQEQLNASCHVLYASIVNGSTHARVADTYLQSLKLRAPYVEKAFGKINTSMVSNNAFWEGQKVKLAYSVDGSNRMVLRYRSKEIEKIIAIDKKGAIDSLSSEF